MMFQNGIARRMTLVRWLLPSIVIGSATVAAQYGQAPTRRLVTGEPIIVPVDSDVAHAAHLRRIARAAPLAGGYVLIADNSQHRLMKFDRHGGLAAEGPLSSDSIGAPVSATAVGEFADESLVVVDQAGGKAHVYSAVRGVISERAQFRIGEVAVDACTAGDKLYVLGYSRGQLVHEYDSKGRAIKSFAQAPGGTEAERSGSLVGGAHIACVGVGTVVLSRNVSADVRGYDQSGGDRWTFSVPDFRAASVRVFPDGSIQIHKNADKVDVTFSAFAASADVVAVQVSRGDRPDPASGREYTVDTFLIGVRDGKLEGVQRGIPEIQAANGRNAIVKVSSRSVRVVPIAIDRGSR